MSVRTGTKDEVIGEGIEAPIDMPPKENIGVWTEGDVDMYSNLDKTMGIYDLNRYEAFIMLIGFTLAVAYFFLY